MSIPTAALRRARESANVNQTEMARRLGVSSNSVISRLEKSEVTDKPMAERYLRAVGTEESLALLDFYSRDWQISKRPDFHHPDREELWTAEQALQDLALFEKDGFDSLLTAPLNLARDSLKTTADYVWRTDYVLAWIGVVGIGKTTALSHLTNLVLPDRDGRPRPIFPAAGGRTTTSEVEIRQGPAFSISVEPKTEDEIRQLVRELVENAIGVKGSITTELERALRNMADLQRRKDPTDPKLLIDPIKEMSNDGAVSNDDVVETIIARMRLEHRTETQLMISEGNAKGLEWLSDTVSDINFGKDSRFSVPHRVLVSIPGSLMRKSPYDITFIDTKGIHGTAIRDDLQRLTAEPRTLCIICCSFNDAPGQEPLRILRELVDAGSDAIERQRVVLLVLPRADEALKVIDDFSEPVETIEDGYTYKSRHIDDSLKEAGIPPVPVVYFNAVEDKASNVWQEITEAVDLIRRRELERLTRFVKLAEELRTNADAHRIQVARRTLAKEALSIAGSYASLPPSIRPAQQSLLRELGISHPSSIAASVVRRGTWYNLDVYHMVGAGVRTDAHLRSRDLIERMKGRLDALRAEFHSTPEGIALVDTVVEDLSDWHQEFLMRAQSVGRNTFKPYLDADNDFWISLKNRYGGGAGYRKDIIENIREWFEQPELNIARKKVDERLEEAWKELVLDKIVEKTAVTDVSFDG